MELDEDSATPLQPSPDSAVAGDRVDGSAERFLSRTTSSAQGSLANVLPMLEEGDDSAALLAKHASEDDAKSLPSDRSRTVSDMSFDVLLEESDVEEGAYYDSMPNGKAKSELRTPGDIRTAVLEWMYEEKDDIQCRDLTLANAPILEDLISVFVSVVLHGKSDVIRSQVWRFLVSCSIHSLHFAFLVICNLNASCHQKVTVEDEMSQEYKKKRQKDIQAIEKVIDTLKKESLTSVDSCSKGLEAKSKLDQVTKVKDSIYKALNQLEEVHDNQVLTNLDLNVRGRTARQNIDLLIQKIRNAIVRGHKEEDEENLRALDGRLGFIKTLTDLDDWLMRSVPREERAAVLEGKLKSLSVALPLGAYFPTAVDRATQKHRTLRLVLEETIVFNTARKCPFLLVGEVEPIPEPPSASFSAMNAHDQHGSNRDLRSPRKVALEALEMVSTKDFWKNPIKEIQHFKERTMSEHSIQEINIDEDDHEIPANDKDAGNFRKLQQERWEDMQDRVRKESPFGDRPNWQLASMFVKAGDDLRQQQLGVLFVGTFQKIFLEEGVPVWLAPYKVIPTGRTCGLLEPARNADSIARIKERGGYTGIDQYFLDRFGPKGSRTYKRAQRNFLQSLAGYSIVAYLIKLHDRHNGNILIDLSGHLMHIDFGFMLGFTHKLERSPFKLTPDMVEILGGPTSATFQSFRRLMEKAFIAANKHHRELILLAELLSVDESSSECFAGGRRWVIDEFRARFCPGLTTRKLRVHINDVIDHSMGNYSTRCYDSFQRCVNGIW